MLRAFKLCFLLAFLFACGSNNEPQVSTDPVIPVEATGKLVLVTGVTGRQGGAVARALLEKGYQVRGLSRNPDSDRARAMAESGIVMVRGNFDDPGSLDEAMKDVHGVFSVTNFWEHGYETEVQHGKNTVDAATRAGVSHLVFSSVANADQQTGIPHFDSKYEIEEYIQRVGIPFTVLRPVSFMENWEYARDSIVAGKLESPFSSATRLQQISVRDIGRFAALAFGDPDNWQGRTLDIAGDQYTLKQAVSLFSQATGSPVEHVQVPWDVYEKAQGSEMTIMDRWIDSVGYSANVNLVRSYLPDMLTLEEYLQQANW